MFPDRYRSADTGRQHHIAAVAPAATQQAPNMTRRGGQRRREVGVAGGDMLRVVVAGAGESRYGRDVGTGSQSALHHQRQSGNKRSQERLLRDMPAGHSELAEPQVEAADALHLQQPTKRSRHTPRQPAAAEQRQRNVEATATLVPVASAGMQFTKKPRVSAPSTGALVECGHPTKPQQQQGDKEPEQQRRQRSRLQHGQQQEQQQQPKRQQVPQQIGAKPQDNIAAHVSAAGRVANGPMAHGPSLASTGTCYWEEARQVSNRQQIREFICGLRKTGLPHPPFAIYQAMWTHVENLLWGLVFVVRAGALEVP